MADATYGATIVNGEVRLEPPAPALRLRRYERVQRVPVQGTDLVGDYADEWVEYLLNPSLDLGESLASLQGLDGLTRVIRAWSFSQDDGTPLPITVEALRALPAEITRWLAETWMAIQAVPKSTSSTSAPGASATAAPSPAGPPSASTPSG